MRGLSARRLQEQSENLYANSELPNTAYQQTGGENYLSWENGTELFALAKAITEHKTQNT